MKITELRLHPIAVADPPLRSSYGRHAPYTLRTIVEVETNVGITGISETYGGDGPLAALHGIRDEVVGRDPWQLASLWRKMDDGEAGGDRSQTRLVPGENPRDERTRTFAAVEVACLDAVGKAIGKAVCDLVGGRVRDEVAFSAYLFYKDGGGGGLGDDSREDEYGECMGPASVVQQCRRMVSKYGFHEIKLKAGVLEPELEIATIRQLRAEFGPEYPLRIDPNCAWSVETSVGVGEALAEELSGGGYLEDPTATLEGMAAVRRQLLAKGFDIPQASNVVTTCFADVPVAKQLDAVQIVLSDPHYWGGVRALQRLSFLCEVLGMGLSMHSNNHLGVSLMTMVHAAAAAQTLTCACDTHYPWQSERDEVVDGGRIPFENGCVRIPDKPGLGIELDYDQVARLEERYRKIPYRRRDDEAEMREHVDPNWKRILPRW